jgi:hypothetical protein
VGLLNETTKEIMSSVISSYFKILPKELETKQALSKMLYNTISHPFRTLIETSKALQTIGVDGGLPITHPKVNKSGIGQ